MNHTFAGRDKEGKRLGVYVKRSTEHKRHWQYTIKGILPDVDGQVPMQDWEAKELLGVDFDRVTKFAWN